MTLIMVSDRYAEPWRIQVSHLKCYRNSSDTFQRTTHGAMEMMGA